MAGNVCYLKLNRNVEVMEDSVFLKDVGSVYCADKLVTAKVKSMKLHHFEKGQGSRCVISVLKITEMIILTGFNIYPSIVKWGGAGALVPITGFANSVAAPAIEFKKEGWVFGVGCKIFSIAGPVILYGIFTSWLLGLGLLGSQNNRRDWVSEGG